MRVFLDTNILLDVLLNRPALADESAAVIARSEELGATMFVAWHGLATVYYLLRRGRTESEALAEVDRILAWAQAAAEACGADWIVTRDASGFRESRVASMSPAAFVAQYPPIL
jgi:predicted nucleic acid-binding protein